MIKTILKLLIEVLGKKAIKAGLEEKLLKNQKYITVAKQIWNVVESKFQSLAATVSTAADSQQAAVTVQ